MKNRKIMVLVVLMLCAMFLFACNDDKNGDNGGDFLNGVFYEYKNGIKQEDSWLKLENGTWSDDDGASGRLEVRDGTVYGYGEIFGYEDVLFYGTIDGGVFRWTFDGNIYYDYYSDGSYGNGSGTNSPETTKVQYTVSFDSMGGTAVDSVKVDEKEKLTAPEQPAKTKYIFNGWYKDSGCTDVWDFDVDTVTGDVTLYAKWLLDETRINAVNGASIDGTEITLIVDDTIDDMDMSDKVVLNSSSATWKLYYDKLGRDEIRTKIATNEQGRLSSGSNLFYIVVTSADSTQSKTYVLDLYKRYYVTISSYDVHNHFLGSYEALTLSELRAPELPTIEGYTVTGWLSSVPIGSPIPKNSRGIDLTPDCTPNTYTVTLNADGGTVSRTSQSVTFDEDVSFPIPEKTGYSFIGWGYGDSIVTEINGDCKWEIARDVTLVARYNANRYTIRVAASDETAGTVSVYCSTSDGTSSETYTTGEYGSTLVLTASINDGYTFTGWYDGLTHLSTELQYRLTVPAESKTYTAKYIPCPITLNKNIEEAGSISGLPQKTAVGEKITVTAETNNGYSWLGWYDEDTKVSEETSLNYTFTMGTESKTYTAKWTYYTVSTNTSMSGAGTYTNYNEQKISVGEEVTLTAETNTGYTWLGWYDEETKVSEGTSLSYTLTMGAENKTLTAKWSHYTITYNLDGGVNGNNPSYFSTFADIITLDDPTHAILKSIDSEALSDGYYRLTKKTTTYTFLGWYTESTFENEVTEITYTGSNVVLYAKWSATATTSTSIETEQVYKRENNYIYFGTYPQTQVTDSTLTEMLTSAAGTLPTSSNSQAWTSYGYYINNSVSNFMWYIDLEYNGEKYRGVYFTSYRPQNTSFSSTTSNSCQNNNGYSTSTVYWFKYDPIKWRILSEENGEALILCEMIIDSQEYYPSSSSSTFSHNGGTGYANNYALSNIRKWLNDTFYNTAFTDLQKEIIQLTTVDNSARSTNPNNNTTEFDSGNNSYACADTEDYIFLLSEQEVTNSAYGFNASYSNYDTARQKKNTDYAKCQGASTYSGGDYDGNGYWWLRSPDFSSSYRVRCVYINGDASYYGPVVYTYCGVVPALVIRLS